MTEKTRETECAVEARYINSICNKCHWGNQCGEDNMRRCGFIDKIDHLDDSEMDTCFDDDYIERLTRVKRRSYRREWDKYMKYIAYDDDFNDCSDYNDFINWRDNYDAE